MAATLFVRGEMTGTILLFLNLSDRHAGVSEGISIAYAEAARVCLDRHHASPKNVDLTHGNEQQTAVAEWSPSRESLRGQWANDIDTTEYGAYALALAGIEITRGLVAIRRAETGSGADYYLGKPGTKPDDLEDCLRLEVSGVDRGRDSAIKARVKQKAQQAANGKSNLPAIASVVAFEALCIASVEVASK